MEDIIDVLTDETNTDPIVLTNGKGEKISFEQIAVIPLDKLYCILKPIDKIEYVKEDEAMVFYVDGSCSPPALRFEHDEKKSIEVFLEYYDLLKEAL